jgi:hypothetical protein
LTKLKEIVFRFHPSKAKNIAGILGTIAPKHEHFKGVSIHLAFTSKEVLSPQSVEEEIYSRWNDLDRRLFLLQESLGIRVKAIWDVMGGEAKVQQGQILGFLGRLLPKMTKRRMVDLECRE